MNNVIHTVAHISVRSYAIAAFKALMDSIREATRAEAGCLSYELFQDRIDPTKFAFLEQWHSEDAFNNHLASSHIASITPQMSTMLVDSIVIQRYCKIW